VTSLALWWSRSSSRGCGQGGQLKETTQNCCKRVACAATRSATAPPCRLRPSNSAHIVLASGLLFEFWWLVVCWTCRLKFSRFVLLVVHWVCCLPHSFTGHIVWCARSLATSFAMSTLGCPYRRWSRLIDVGSWDGYASSSSSSLALPRVSPHPWTTRGGGVSCIQPNWAQSS